MFGWKFGKTNERPRKMHDKIIVSVSWVSRIAWKIREQKLSVERENPVDSAKKYEKGIKMKHKLEKINM